jgi:hypothetical protein
MVSGTVGERDRPGLFRVALDRGSMSGERVAAASPWREIARTGSDGRQSRAVRRYCAGCSRETEHVPWASEGPTSIASIRWPVAEPMIGARICRQCGQVRAAASQVKPPDWSGWPRKPNEPAAKRADALREAKSAPEAQERAPEAAAENEGMPPRPEPGRVRRPG